MSSIRLFGTLFALLAMCLFNLAPVFQKSALDRQPPLSFSNLRNSLGGLLRDRRWMLGFAIGCLGLPPYAAAMRLVGVAVVQPLYGFGVLVLVLASRAALKERLHPAAKGALALLILMPLLIAAGDVSGAQADLTQPGPQGRLGLFTLTVLLLSGGLTCFARAHPFLWAPISGLLFGAGAVFAQAAVSLLAWDELRDATTFQALIRRTDLLFSLGAVLAAIPLNLFADYCMQVGLQRKSASRFLPVAQTVNNLAAVAGGILVFGQRAANWPLYATGLVAGLVGLSLLARFKHGSEDAVKV
jgi:hypothetical protein